MNLIEQRPSRWLLPAWWRRWEGYVIDTVDGRPTVQFHGPAPPIQLSERLINEFLYWLESRFDPSGDSLALAVQVGSAVTRFGPLSPAQPNEGRLTAVAPGVRVSVPDVPSAVDVDSTVDDLHVLRIGCRMAYGIADGDHAAVEAQLNEFDSRARSVDTRWTSVYPDLSLFAEWSAADALQFKAPAEPVGTALQLLAWMSQRWPVRFYAAAQFDYRPIPLPQSPVHIVWVSLAHAVGILALPFGPRVRYCAYCRKPVFSSRPRKSGSRWFCDPEKEGTRSPCQNRFFVEQSRRAKSSRKEETPE